MSSNQHHHEKAPDSSFPDGFESSASRARASFPVRTAPLAVIGQPTRPHVGNPANTQANNAWSFNVVNHHPPASAQTYSNAITAIFRTPWWNAQAHPPPAEAARGDPFDALVEGPNYSKCVICGSSNGKTCVKAHLDYHP